MDGTPLRPLLEEAGIEPDAVEVVSRVRLVEPGRAVTVAGRAWSGWGQVTGAWNAGGYADNAAQRVPVTVG